LSTLDEVEQFLLLPDGGRKGVSLTIF